MVSLLSFPEAGAEVIATACPYCIRTLNEAVAKLGAAPERTIFGHEFAGRIAEIGPESDEVRNMSPEKAREVFKAMGNEGASTHGRGGRHPMMHRCSQCLRRCAEWTRFRSTQRPLHSCATVGYSLAGRGVVRGPSSTQAARWVAEDVEMHGRTIPAGSAFLCLVGSANRDEREFEGPDRFDIHRKIGHHLTFAYGVHFCLGAALARLESLRARLHPMDDFELWFWAAMNAGTHAVNAALHHAGVTRDGLLMRMSDADWDTVVDTNLKGAFLVSKAFSRAMIKARTGKIINISSVIGLIGNAGANRFWDFTVGPADKTYRFDYLSASGTANGAAFVTAGAQLAEQKTEESGAEPTADVPANYLIEVPDLKWARFYWDATAAEFKPVFLQP